MDRSHTTSARGASGCTSREAMMKNELGQRTRACRGWRWVDGTRWRLVSLSGRITEHGYQTPPPDDAWPDLDDPATLGCLLGLVREASGDLGAHVKHVGEAYPGCRLWVAVASGQHYLAHGEAEALVMALESAS